MTEKNFYITSPIYYVNDIPHIGHAYTSLACDVLARTKRLEGYNVHFLTGTDEHGQKVEKSALLKGKTPEQFCDEISFKFRELADFMNYSYSDFIRTTEDRHKKTAQIFWKKLQKNGWIYKDVYEGWYALRDEAFYGEDELINGKAPTGAEVEWHKEESYFFKLSAFQNNLLALYDAVPDFIKPDTKRNEVISFVKSGLKDLSISRTSFKWGVPVPGDEKHIMYVWLDALTNYISALDFNNENNPQNNSENKNLYQDFWCNTTDSPIHIVGKDILRFHCVYWPAFLMAADLPIPNRVFAHGWWTNEGQKISKSLGNVIDPYQEISWLEGFKYKEKQGEVEIEKNISRETGIDYFRYFLLKEVPFGNDGDYCRENLINRVNAELANNIGNLIQRSLTMIIKNCDWKIPDCKPLKSGDYSPILAQINELSFTQALEKIIDLSNQANKYFNDQAPWNLKRENKINEMNQVLFETAESIRIIALLLLAFIPNSANKILDLLNVKVEERNLQSFNKKIKSGQKISQPQIIFPNLRP